MAAYLIMYIFLALASICYPCKKMGMVELRKEPKYVTIILLLLKHFLFLVHFHSGFLHQQIFHFLPFAT